MMKIGKLLILFSLVGCSHTFHIDASDDGKTAWMADTKILFNFFFSSKYFCEYKNDEKPVCYEAYEDSR